MLLRQGNYFFAFPMARIKIEGRVAADGPRAIDRQKERLLPLKAISRSRMRPNLVVARDCNSAHHRVRWAAAALERQKFQTHLSRANP
ncbi:hypothetical protein [Novosphingobium kaempferiae]|uniref:hypothetical protein n=1 Tax=Novosphingobium kaempferiae TaxID=2896849 RepID=UPI001E61E206|nr:hypothetical protein [Novosphingobium kaempferiae]